MDYSALEIIKLYCYNFNINNHYRRFQLYIHCKGHDTENFYFEIFVPNVKKVRVLIEA